MRLSGAQWATTYRRLSPEVASDWGTFSFDGMAFQREWHESVTDELVERTILMTSAQVGKSTFLENVAGYFMHHDPAPSLLIWPTLEDAEELAVQRIDPLINYTPELRDLVMPTRVKDGSTKLYRRFPGGFLSMGGANSPRKLAARSIRVFLADEIDRWPDAIGEEGNPLMIGPERTVHFWNRVLCFASTPTTETKSKIYPLFMQGTQEYFYVPCQHCETFMTLVWEMVLWDRGDPSSARLACPHCGSEWSDRDRLDAVASGHYRAHNPDCGRPWRSFHISALYSLITNIPALAQAWEDAEGSILDEQTFVNLKLGLPYRRRVINVKAEDVRERREPYGIAEDDPVPAGVCCVVAAVDVQHNRVEVEFVGYGVGGESWGLGYLQIMGSFDKVDTRKELDRLVLNRTFEHPAGVRLRVLALGVDAGYMSQHVHRYCKARAARRVYAVKGVGDQVGRPFVGLAQENNPERCSVFPLNVSIGKTLIMDRLTIDRPGRGYCHFPDAYENAYFDGLVSEKLVEKVKQGRKVAEWEVIHERNEQLDIRVYSLAVLDITRVNLAELAARLENRSDSDDTQESKPAAPRKKRRTRRRPRKVPIPRHRL